ncbi:hypothetical protein CBOM_05382 [Ceraceosorus bombacis]|uniref:Uncharacterized protein n=1 Tax=Ceraceosorus bombacis TaxID=401625 RepID=A0A0P1BRS6_9BASI|nr:hypothetical protein CBOM_05382 [Ceraceosorus bombacis]
MNVNQTADCCYVATATAGQERHAHVLRQHQGRSLPMHISSSRSMQQFESGV